MLCHRFVTCCRRPAWHGPAARIRTSAQGSMLRCAIIDTAEYRLQSVRLCFAMPTLPTPVPAMPPPQSVKA